MSRQRFGRWNPHRANCGCEKEAIYAIGGSPNLLAISYHYRHDCRIYAVMREGRQEFSDFARDCHGDIDMNAWLKDLNGDELSVTLPGSTAGPYTAEKIGANIILYKNGLLLDRIENDYVTSNPIFCIASGGHVIYGVITNDFSEDTWFSKNARILFNDVVTETIREHRLVLCYQYRSGYGYALKNNDMLLMGGVLIKLRGDYSAQLFVENEKRVDCLHALRPTTWDAQERSYFFNRMVFYETKSSADSRYPETVFQSNHFLYVVDNDCGLMKFDTHFKRLA